MKFKAFTLIELLVVIAIIAILAAILFPVFAQAKAAAKKTVDLTHMREVGVAFMLYANDNDDAFPLTTFSSAEGHTVSKNSWAVQCQPYIKSWTMFRSPADASKFWPTTGNWPDVDAPESDPRWTQYRTSSYLLNIFMSGDYKGGAFSTTNSITSPASTIYVALARDDVAPRDHFHPTYWGSPSTETSPFMQNLTWDAAKNETKELKLTAFAGGENYTYVDGHAQFKKWSQVWWRDVANNVLAGNFDPRNSGR